MRDINNEMSMRLMEIDNSLKGMGYERRTKEQQTTLDGIAARLETIEATVKELNGMAPARGYRASTDAPALDPAIMAVLKGEAPSTDPLAAVTAWLTQPR
jgi:hypothetical protein